MMVWDPDGMTPSLHMHIACANTTPPHPPFGDPASCLLTTISLPPFLVLCVVFTMCLSLQIHDELVFEVRSDALHESAALIRHEMESASLHWGLRVPLPVQIRVGPSWGQLEAYEHDENVRT